MKSTVKKISFSIILALVMACTLLLGVLCLHTGKTAVSHAAGRATAVKIEVDKTSVAKGGKFTFTITVTPQATDMTWNSAHIVLVPTEQDGTPISQTEEGLKAVLKDFSVDGDADPTSGIIPGMGTMPDGFSGGYRIASYYNAVGRTESNRMGFAFSIASLSNGQTVGTDTPLTMTVEVKISEDFELPESGSTKFTFTVRKNNSYSSVDYDNGAIRINSSHSDFTVENSVDIIIRDSNTEANLSGIKIAHDKDGSANDHTAADVKTDSTLVDWPADDKIIKFNASSESGIAGVAEYKLLDPDILHFHLNPIPDKGAEGDDTADPVVPARASSEGATVKAKWENSDFSIGTVVDLTKDNLNNLFGTISHDKIADAVTDKQDLKIFLQVTSEDGNKTNVYQINVSIGYVRLGLLEGGKYSTTDGVTKDGVVYNKVVWDDAKSEYGFENPETLDFDKTNFDSEQEDFWVYIPNDFKIATEGGEPQDSPTGSIAIKASVLMGYGANIGIKVTDTTEYADGIEETAKIKVPADAVESGSDISITNIPKDSATYVVKFTVTANDGTTTKEYTLHLQVVSVENTLKDLYVRGQDSAETDKVNFTDGRKYENENYDDEQHPEIPKEGAYFFTIYEETDTKKGRVIFEPNDTNVVIEYKANSEYPSAEPKDFTTLDKSTALGYYYFDSDAATITYDLRVTAEAGNSTTFTVTLSIANVIKMKPDATFYFLREVVEPDGEDIYYYRRTYAELGEEVEGKPVGWTHGKEDMIPINKPEKFVLGQIGARVTINDLLAQIETNSQLLRIYDKDNLLLYKDGMAQNDAVLEEPDPDDEDAEDIEVNYLGTGWRIEYWLSNEDTEAADVVWISVLGDVDTNDDVDGGDSSALALYIMGNRTSAVGKLLTLEGRLAAYIWNDGLIAAGDLARLNYVIATGAYTESEVDGVMVRDLDLLLAEHFYPNQET